MEHGHFVEVHYLYGVRELEKKLAISEYLSAVPQRRKTLTHSMSLPCDGFLLAFHQSIRFVWRSQKDEPHSDEHPRDARRQASAPLPDVQSAAFRGHLQHQSLDGPQGLGGHGRRPARQGAAAMG